MLEKLQRLFLRTWLPITVLLLLLITTASLIPLPQLPGKDKANHFIAYALLALPISIAKPKHYYVYLLLFFCWSGVLEIIQPYVNRYGELNDLVANGLGLILGFLIGSGVKRIMF